MGRRFLGHGSRQRCGGVLAGTGEAAAGDGAGVAPVSSMGHPG